MGKLKDFLTGRYTVEGLGKYLKKNWPREIKEGEPPVKTAIRLLEKFKSG